MKKLFIAGNWKSNKTIAEAKEWIAKFSSYQIPENNTVVILAPYTVLESLADAVKTAKSSLALGAQNISKFDEGAYTGEISGKMIKETADWVIIGHSERRKYFSESDADLTTKVEKAHAAGLKVIFCVQDENTPVPATADVVAYEPVWAIGTGKTDSPENANSVVAKIKQKTGATVVIYGGSVTDGNVTSFVGQPSIDGVLPGGASLDPEKFTNLIQAAFSAPV